MNTKAVRPDMLDVVLNSISDPFFVLNSEWKCTYWNNSAENLTGLNTELVLGKTLDAILPESDYGEIAQTIKELALNEKSHSIKRAIQIKNQLYWFEILIQPFDGDLTVLLKDLTLKNQKSLINKTHKIAGIGTWWADVLNGVSYWDDIVYRIHEVEAKTEIEFDKAIEFYHPDYRQMATDCVTAGIIERKSWDFEAILVTAKGNEKWVRAIGYPVIREDEVRELRGLFIDISEQKAIQQDQNLSKEQLEHLFNNIGDLVCLHSPDGTYLKVSPSAEDITGYTQDELTGKYPYDFFHPDDKERILTESHLRILNEQADRASIEYRFKHKDGTYRWFWSHTESIKNERGDIIQLVSSTKDITEIKLDKEQILHLNNTLELRFAESSQELNSLNFEIDQMSEAMDAWAILSVTDQHGNITHVNQNFCDISGYSREELIGRNHRIIKSDHHPAGLFKGMWAAISQGRIWKGEICNKRKDGSRYWVHTTIYPFKNITGEIIKYISVRFDITEMKFQDRELRLKSRLLETNNKKLEQLNHELETFSYSVSHDLKAPLRTLQGFSKNLINRYGGQMDETANRWLEFIQINAERMDKLIGDILSYSKIGRKEMDRSLIKTSGLVLKTFNEQKSSYHNKTEIVMDELPDIFGDELLIGLVWQNLIGNALKYSSHNEIIKIEVKHEEKEGFHFFTVIDNGIGFDMKYHDKLFGIFQRLHGSSEFEGTGVGLANVKRGVEKHGGIVEAFGEIGKGARFTFSIPVHSNSNSNQ